MTRFFALTGAALLAVTLAACGGPDAADDDTPEAVNGQMEYVDGDGDAAGDDNSSDDMAGGGDQPAYSAGTDPDFIAGCLQSSNLSRAMCTCIAAAAEEELSDDERAFLTASLNQDAEAATEFRMRLDVMEAANVGVFMSNSTRSCAERGFND